MKNWKRCGHRIWGTIRGLPKECYHPGVHTKKVLCDPYFSSHPPKDCPRLKDWIDKATDEQNPNT